MKRAGDLLILSRSRWLSRLLITEAEDYARHESEVMPPVAADPDRYVIDLEEPYAYAGTCRDIYSAAQGQGEIGVAVEIFDLRPHPAHQYVAEGGHSVAARRKAR